MNLFDAIRQTKAQGIDGLDHKDIQTLTSQVPHWRKVEQYLQNVNLSKQYINNRFFAMQKWIDYIVEFRIRQRDFEAICADQLAKEHFIVNGPRWQFVMPGFSCTTVFQIRNQKPMCCEEFTAWISMQNPKLPL